MVITLLYLLNNMRKYLYLSVALLAIGYGCKKKDKKTDTGNAYSTITISKPAVGDTVSQKEDSTVIEFDVTDPVKIDTVFMQLQNPSGGAMYFGYFVVNDKNLHYKGYHKVDDGVSAPTKQYRLHVEAHNSSKHSTVATREFVLVP